MGNEVDSNVTELYEKRSEEIIVAIVLETRQKVESDDEFLGLLERSLRKVAEDAEAAEDANQYFKDFSDRALTFKKSEDGDFVDGRVIVNLDAF